MNENTNRLTDEAFAQQIMHSARTIQPDATFASELEQTLAQLPRQKSRPSPQRIIRLVGTVAAVLTLAVVSVLTVPPLRAIAQEIISLLSRSKADEGIGYFMEQPPVQMFASIEKAEADLSRDFVVPQYLPSVTMSNKEIPVSLITLSYIAETSSVEIVYAFALGSRWSLTFWQTPSEVYYRNGPTSIGASAEIESVTFNFRDKPVSGQFVKGGWVSNIDLDEAKQQEALQTATPNSVDLKWSRESGQMYLIWEADGVVYHFFTSESSSLNINRDELIRIAESIE